MNNLNLSNIYLVYRHHKYVRVKFSISLNIHLLIPLSNAIKR